MKIKIHGYDLAYAVGRVAKAVAVRSTTPVLEGIKISTDGDFAVFTATDLELGIETRVKCEVIESGATVVVGKVFADCASALPTDGYVDLTSDGKQVKVKCGGVKLAIAVLNEAEFPKLNDHATTGAFEIATEDLKRMVGGTAFACATDEARPILKGCLFEVQDGYLHVCALDGYRMAVKKCKVEAVDGEVKAVIPARALTELLRLLGDEKAVRVELDYGSLSVETEDTTFTARLLNGTFVDYKALLSAPVFATTVVDKAELLSAHARAKIVADLKSNAVHCTVADGKLTLAANSELGESEETIEVAHSGRNIDLYFNNRFLTDSLKAIPDDKVALCFGKDNTSPLFVRPADFGDYDYLILPVRVGRS